MKSISVCNPEYDWRTHQIDFNNVFLNRDLSEDVYKVLCL